MSVGNLKTNGNKGNNFPFQSNTLIILEQIRQAIIAGGGGGGGGCCPATIRTPSVQRVVAAGTIAAGARAVSIANVGDQTGTVLGTNLKGGEVISFSAGSDQDTLSAIAYNPGTSEFLITTIV